MKIVFFGTPKFSTIILEALIVSGYAPVLVVTAGNKPVGRNKVITPPPVKVLALEHQIRILQPQDLESIEPDLKALNPDLVIVAAYGPPFLTQNILQYNCLNVHPSLLPKYRGASPIPGAILSGEGQTGVTIIKMTDKIDHGDIVAQEKLAIESQDTAISLTEKLAQLAAQLLVKTIPLWIKEEIVSRSQGQSPTPYCPQLKKQDGRINWQNNSEYIERQIRAYHPWPGTFTLFKGQILKILKGYVTEKEETKLNPGFVFLTKAEKKLAVQTKKGVLVIEMLQLEGGKPLSAEDFFRGHREIIGAILQ